MSGVAVASRQRTSEGTDDVESSPNGDDEKVRQDVRRFKRKKKARIICCSASAGPACRRAASICGLRFSDSKADLNKAKGTILWATNQKELNDILTRISQKARVPKATFVSKLPGSKRACEKVVTARQLNLSSELSTCAGEFCFWPQTFILPRDREVLEACLSKRSKYKKRAARSLSRGKNSTVNRTTFILKPSSASQGDGIFLVQTQSDLRRCGALACGDMVAQRYVSNPMLIDGFKFDLRLYVLVSCLDPLTVHMCKEGLVRLASTSYEAPVPSNLSAATMHLTNYSLNKHSDKFNHAGEEDPSRGEGNKRTLTQVLAQLVENGQVTDIELLWGRLYSLVRTTMQALAPLMQDAAAGFTPSGHPTGSPEKAPETAKSTSRSRAYDAICGGTCFQIFGFDVMLDSEQRPILLEVNNSPSMRVDGIRPVETASAGATEGNDDASMQARAENPEAKVCRCMDSHLPHVHHDSAVDMQIKSLVLAGAINVLRGSVPRSRGPDTHAAPIHGETKVHPGGDVLDPWNSYKLVCGPSDAQNLLQRVSRVYHAVVGRKRKLDSYKWRKVVAALSNSSVARSTADLQFRAMRNRVCEAEGTGNLNMGHFTELLADWCRQQTAAADIASEPLGLSFADAVSRLEVTYECSTAVRRS